MWLKLRWLIIIPLLLIGALLLLNSFDRKLAPEAEDYAQPVARQIPLEQNAFYYLLGFLAPEGEDPHSRGQQAAARYEESLRSGALSQGFNVYEGVTPAGLKDWDRPICNQHDASCMDAVLERKADVRRALSANQLLLRRYDALYAYASYADPLTPHLSAPIATGSVFPTQALWLAGQALNAAQGDVTGTLAALQRDLSFWRQMAGQPAGLVHKMVAVGCIARDVRLLSDLLRTAALGPAQMEQINVVLRPLDDSEKSLAPAIREEFRLVYHGLSNFNQLEEAGLPEFSDSPGLMKRPLYHHNATANQIYATYRDYEQLAEMPPAEYLRQRDLLRERHERESDYRSWKILYNPVGRILLGVANPDLRSYPGRVHDLEGLLRLVRLQARVRANGVELGAVAGFVAAAGDEYADPYTGQPMQLDSDQRQLFFVGQGRAKGERIAVKL